MRFGLLRRCNNALIRRNKTILSDLNRLAHDLHAYLLTGKRVGKSSPTPLPASTVLRAAGI